VILRDSTSLSSEIRVLVVVSVVVVVHIRALESVQKKAAAWLQRGTERATVFSAFMTCQRTHEENNDYIIKYTSTALTRAAGKTSGHVTTGLGFL
jgi:hypothetical protein